MREGWHGDNYWVLFDRDERAVVSARYAMDTYLPGYEVAGLYGWDDLAVVDPAGSYFRVPVVPLGAEHLRPLDMPPPDAKMDADARFTRKVKWYVKPIVLGGDPSSGDNLVWVTHDQHSQLAVFWNKQLQQIRAANDA
jgi:hypothetical protein